MSDILNIQCLEKNIFPFCERSCDVWFALSRSASRKPNPRTWPISSRKKISLCSYSISDVSVVYVYLTCVPRLNHELLILNRMTKFHFWITFANCMSKLTSFIILQKFLWVCQLECSAQKLTIAISKVSRCGKHPSATIPTCQAQFILPLHEGR